MIKTALSREDLLKKARRLVNLSPERVNPGQEEPTGKDSENSAIAVGPDGKLGDVPADSAEVDADSGAGSDAARLQALIDNWE